jgi:hydroxymethylpyrimidine/phosphomethylpyrimidine kinase
MKKIKSGKPVVLVFGGHDPSGCAGIQADIESIAAQGCHAATVITMLTTQSFNEFISFRSCDSEDAVKQAELLLDSMDIRAVKIGAIGSLSLLDAIVDILSRVPALPVVLDPVLASTTGHDMASDDLMSSMIETLLPRVEILTPNTHEAALLSGINDNPDAAAGKLLEQGCRHVLLTGTHATTDNVINRYYNADDTPASYEYQRLPGEYRGSGCLLASAIAANRASGLDVQTSIEHALEYTWQCLKAASTNDDTIHIPDRMRWKIQDDRQ